MITSRAAVVAVAAFGLSVVPLAATAIPAHAASGVYANCTALHKKYPHGVGRSNAHDHVSGHSKPVTNFTHNTTVYNAAIKANRGLDRDHDGIACEQH